MVNDSSVRKSTDEYGKLIYVLELVPNRTVRTYK
jgi:hypothetical protein